MPTPPPPTQISVKISKTFPYRGSTIEWSNRYFLNATALPSSANQDAIADLIEADEKGIYGSRVTIVRNTWYAAGSDVPVRTRSRSIAGTLSYTGCDKTPGDCATVIRFSTTQRTSKNHPIYLFKYFHDALTDEEGDPDLVKDNQFNRLGYLAATIVTGMVVGGITYKLAGPYGAVAQGYLVSPKTTHRDFPR